MARVASSLTIDRRGLGRARAWQRRIQAGPHWKRRAGLFGQVSCIRAPAPPADNEELKRGRGPRVKVGASSSQVGLPVQDLDGIVPKRSRRGGPVGVAVIYGTWTGGEEPARMVGVLGLQRLANVDKDPRATQRPEPTAIVQALARVCRNALDLDPRVVGVKGAKARLQPNKQVTSVQLEARPVDLRIDLVFHP